MKRESLPTSEVVQLNSRVDAGQQNTSTAALTPPSPHNSRDADQRSRLTDKPRRPGVLSETDATRAKLGLTGGGQIPEVTYSSQDDDWNETCTATSHQPTSSSSAACSPGTKPRTLSRTVLNIYRRYASSLLAVSISVTSFLSPIVMVSLPLCSHPDLKGASEACDPNCEGLLISLSFKLLILLVGTWALFARRPQASNPRLSVFRSLVLFAAALLTLSYWLFYGVRILRPGVKDYRVIVGFASSLVDALLFVHYLAVVLLRIRPVIGGQFVVKIVRSPDGQSRSYSVGPMSIQSLAVCCLQHYYRDFSVYSPYLDRIHRGGTEMQKSSGSAAAAAEYKLYSVDDASSPLDPASPDATAGVDASGSRGHAAGSSTSGSGCLARRRRDNEERLREWQRKLDRRRSMLIYATEEAFSRVSKVDGTEEGKPAECASVQEASEVVFGWLSRPLHRYLRLVRQHPPYSKQAVLDHISSCISHEMSARSFLERYLQQTPVGLAPSGTGTLGDEGEGGNEWTLVSDKLLNATAENCTTFEMRRDPVRLLVTVREIPYLCLTQGSSDSRSKWTVLKPNGQTTREIKL